MPSATLLTNRVNYSKDIDLVRDLWIRDLLAFIGLDVVLLDSMPKDHIIELFKKNKIELIFFSGAQSLLVKYNGDIVGEWGSPKIELFEENGVLYNKITIEYWSVIDKQLDIEE